MEATEVCESTPTSLPRVAGAAWCGSRRAAKRVSAVSPRRPRSSSRSQRGTCRCCHPSCPGPVPPRCKWHNLPPCACGAAGVKFKGQKGGQARRVEGVSAQVVLLTHVHTHASGAGLAVACGQHWLGCNQRKASSTELQAECHAVAGRQDRGRSLSLPRLTCARRRPPSQRYRSCCPPPWEQQPPSAHKKHEGGRAAGWGKVLLKAGGSGFALGPPTHGGLHDASSL